MSNNQCISYTDTNSHLGQILITYKYTGTVLVNILSGSGGDPDLAGSGPFCRIRIRKF
jgi:hypothetical protein